MSFCKQHFYHFFAPDVHYAAYTPPLPPTSTTNTISNSSNYYFIPVFFNEYAGTKAKRPITRQRSKHKKKTYPAINHKRKHIKIKKNKSHVVKLLKQKMLLELICF